MEADVGTENSGLPRAVQLHIADLESHVSGLTQQLAIEAKIHEAHAARYEKLKARQEAQTRTASRLHARALDEVGDRADLASFQLSKSKVELYRWRQRSALLKVRHSSAVEDADRYDRLCASTSRLSAVGAMAAARHSEAQREATRSGAALRAQLQQAQELTRAARQEAARQEAQAAGFRSEAASERERLAQAKREADSERERRALAEEIAASARSRAEAAEGALRAREGLAAEKESLAAGIKSRDEKIAALEEAARQRENATPAREMATAMRVVDQLVDHLQGTDAEDEDCGDDLFRAPIFPIDAPPAAPLDAGLGRQASPAPGPEPVEAARVAGAGASAPSSPLVAAEPVEPAPRRKPPARRAAGQAKVNLAASVWGEGDSPGQAKESIAQKGKRARVAAKTSLSEKENSSGGVGEPTKEALAALAVGPATEIDRPAGDPLRALNPRPGGLKPAVPGKRKLLTVSRGDALPAAAIFGAGFKAPKLASRAP
ncbi:hypothetical protein F751_2724 [Auxenochlorella protothecoides]|uniref:Uncharacterized protein n=2 Tax=Auxenochlorella protothecoides TaxID=3075 RepID=A0A087SPS9_AUXPR|nr:hypothetical protein F751_2724 [Auxenochlorella protothecoides]KFM27733.1 hypothetical protein F751_2724 [Auxenochlorella protothecoides]